MSQILQADYTWTGTSFEKDIQVEVGDDGTIQAVGAIDRAPTRRLGRRALAPGFVSAHSHAFQRGLRGRGEEFAGQAGSFWSWRQEMYRLVLDSDPDRIYRLSRQAFREMLLAGITSVGEFHYLHHDASGRGYALDEAVLQAARDAGIRIALISSYYRTGGIGRPLEAAQERFRAESPTDYWRQIDRIAAKLAPATQSLGASVHSIRAASIEEIVEIHAEARRRQMVFHIHVEEQRQEVDDSLMAYQSTPLELLIRRLAVGDEFTAIHCTHSRRASLERLAEAGGTVCICPLTEANLGDGIPDLPFLVEKEAAVAVGTDSNSRLCMLEELRWLEYAQRLKLEERGALRHPDGLAARLLRFATRGGARSLGLECGAIQPGLMADFVSFDLDSDELTGCDEESLAAAIVFGAGNRAVAEVSVGGQWFPDQHPH